MKKNPGRFILTSKTAMALERAYRPRIYGKVKTLSIKIVPTLARHGACRRDDLFHARQKFLFKRRPGGDRRKRRGDAQDRTVQIVKNFLLDSRDDFGADAALLDGFVDNDQTAGFLDRIRDRLDIQAEKCSAGR